MQYTFFPEIEKLQQDIKTYLALSKFTNQAELLNKINQQRFDIARLACYRMLFYEQTNILQGSADETQTVYFNRGDLKSICKRAIADLDMSVNIGLTHQGIREQVFTRNPIGWQQLFSAVQNAASSANGQNLPFDFPTEIYFNENDSLQITVENQQAAGFLFWHGCNLIDNSINESDIRNEINTSELPQVQYIPLTYVFGGAAGTYATDGQGNENIYTIKSDRSVILTHVSVMNSTLDEQDSSGGLDCRITLIDDGRNQQICDLVEMRGVAASAKEKYTSYYPLPYPYLLMRQNRIKARVLNGSNITSEYQASDDINYLNFAGFTI